MKLQGIHKSVSLQSGKTLTSASARFKNFNETAAFLRKMADQYGKDRAVREHTVKIITENCESRDKSCQAMAIAEWTQQNVYYVHEGFETFQNPITTLKTLAGDCDDFTTLICACLTSIGIKNAMCILQVAGKWAHIFPVAILPTPQGEHRMTLDATLREPIRDLVNPIAKIKASGRNLTQVKFV